MRQRLETVLRRYGQAVTVLPSPQEGWAFLQPVPVRQIVHSHTPLGMADGRRWSYIGSGETPLTAGDRLVCRMGRFRVLEAAAVQWLDEKPLYWRALLAKEKEAAA